MLKNKVIVITGGGGLLGSQFCSAIAEHGAIAIVADLNLEAANNVAEKINKKFSGKAVTVKLDITNKKSVCDVIDKLENDYGRIDALVNNAYPRNSNYGRNLEEVSYEDFCENVGLHLGGYFLVAQQFGLYFREHNGGNIINMSSIYASMAPRFEIYAGTKMTMPVEYAAIKSALVQLTSYFAQYFKGNDIRVNSLSPGGILDGQPEIFLQKYNEHCNSKGMLDPQDISSSLLFLLSDASKFITGQNMIVDDGFTL